MNKNLKKTIAVALTLSAFAAISPATEYNLFTTKAYADSDDENTEDKLDKLELETSGGKSIQLYDDKDMGSSDKVDDDDVDEGETYYAKTSSSKISISTSGPKSKYIRVFNGTSSNKKGKKTSSDISLSSGTNTIVVRIYNEEPDSSPKYSDDDDVIGTYTIKVKYTGSDSDSDNDEDDNDDIYLDKIELSEGDISFSKNTTTYDVKVDDDVDEIKITAEPDDEDEQTVRIDGSKVDEDDDWEKEIDLEKGKNKIEVTVEDDDDNKRTYTLNITRGQVSTTPDTIYLDTLKVGGTSLTLSEDKKEYNLKFKSDTKKIQIYADPKDSGYEVTIDGTEVDSKDGYKKNVDLEDGKVKSFKVKVKHSSGTEQVYTLNIGRGDDLKSSDFPAINTETTNNNNSVNNNINSVNTNTNNGQSSNIAVGNSANANKWVSVNGKWQFNDSKGVPLKSQWHYDSNYGKEYYLDQNGNMATGWLNLNGEWYYLGSDGGKKTGWQYDGSAWYYMDGRGVMLKNTVIGGYRLQANGAWDWR